MRATPSLANPKGRAERADQPCTPLPFRLSSPTMITKILFTILIVVAALTFVRHKNQQQVRRAEGAGPDKPGKAPLYAALAFATLTVATSGLLYYFHWSDRHTIFNVQVINSHTGQQQTYQAYRDDIGRRNFRTTDGRQINLADSERMEVQEAPESAAEE